MSQPKFLLPKSDVGIAALRAGDLAVELGDGSGLRLRVNALGQSGRGGAKVWRWFVAVDGKRQNVTLGTWARDRSAGLTLKDARNLLADLKEAQVAGRLAEELAKLQKDRTPAAAGSQGDGAQEGELTVEAVAKDFRSYIAKKRKRPEEVDRTFDSDILPALGKRPVRAVTRKEIRELISAVVERGAPTQAGRVLAHIRQFYRFARTHVDDLNVDPTADLDPEALGVVNRACDRFLSAEEIGAFWRALGKSSTSLTVRGALRLLLLTGVRSGELLRATWSEVDLEAATWTVPVAHQKLTKSQEAKAKAKPWAVPLSPAAIEILTELQALARSLIPAEQKEKGLAGRAVVGSVANEGEPLSEKALIAAMRKLFAGKEPLLKFDGERPTPHDLRRTVRTHLGDTLEIEYHVAERCLNHKLPGVGSIYDRGDYLTQRRAALEKWAAYVERLVSGKAAKVVQMKEAGGT